jgi:hypothetical protein
MERSEGNAGRHCKTLVVLTLANWVFEYLMNPKAHLGSHHPALGHKTLFALIFLWHSP